MSAIARPPKPKGARPRWVLRLQAQFWRFLMNFGMFLHQIAPPHPPSPSFTRTISAKLSPRKGDFTLQFYVPSNYEAQRRSQGKKFPVLVNFHGGGFTLGQATDDSRWIGTVVDQVQAVVVSVDYRLAPEFPFPTAIEDGADSILYIAEHADELHIDVDRIAVSGFSSGGNMAFTVPLRLQGELPSLTITDRKLTHIEGEGEGASATVPQRPREVKQSMVKVAKDVKIRGIVSWYPSTDYTQTREQRRKTNSRPDQHLPAVFTELFDQSYLHPPSLDTSNPYLSPGVAPRDMLAELPDDIVLFTCEWDMLLAEGERMRDRLVKEVGKNVHYHMVPGVPHAWDKAPNPLRQTPGVMEHYLTACKELKRILRQ